MPPFKRFFLALFLSLLLIGSFATLWISDHYVVPIIMYHHVRYPLTPNQLEDNTVNPENFEKHMQYLQKNKFEVLSLEELVESIKTNKKLKRKSVVITLDDGYDNNYANAFPILKKYGFPATIFLVTGLMGTPGYLTWDQIREMQQHHITIGAHTVTHVYLPEHPPEKQVSEIKGSKEAIEANLQIPAIYFCYPIGGFSEAIKNIVKENGFEAAVTTNRGFNRFNQDLYELKRIRLSDSDDSKVKLRVKLSGYNNLFRSLKNPY